MLWACLCCVFVLCFHSGVALFLLPPPRGGPNLILLAHLGPVIWSGAGASGPGGCGVLEPDWLSYRPQFPLETPLSLFASVEINCFSFVHADSRNVYFLWTELISLPWAIYNVVPENHMKPLQPRNSTPSFFGCETSPRPATWTPDTTRISAQTIRSSLWFLLTDESLISLYRHTGRLRVCGRHNLETTNNGAFYWW